MLVAVHAGRGVEVEDGLEADVGVAEDLGEGLDQDRAVALVAGEAGLAQQGGLVEVDVDGGPAAQRGELAHAQGGEPLDGGVQVRGCPGGAPAARGRLGSSSASSSSAGSSGSCSAGMVCSRRSLRRSAGRASQPRARERSSSWCVVVAVGGGEDVGDAVEQGVEPGGVAGGDAGDDGAVAVLVAAGEGGVAAVPLGLAAHRRGSRGRPR